MQTPPSPNRPPINAYLDVAGRVVAGVVCDGCRYDLRGQPGAGRCPECGEAIEPMLRAMVQEDARRPWLVAGVACAALLSLVCLGVSYLIEVKTNNFSPPRIDGAHILGNAMGGCGLMAMVAGLVAVITAALQRPGLLVLAWVSALGLLLAGLLFFVLLFLLAFPL